MERAKEIDRVLRTLMARDTLPPSPLYPKNAPLEHFLNGQKLACRLRQRWTVATGDQRPLGFDSPT